MGTVPGQATVQFLAPLDEVQEELCTTPGIGVGGGGVSKMLEFFM